MFLINVLINYKSLIKHIPLLTLGLLLEDYNVLEIVVVFPLWLLWIICALSTYISGFIFLSILPWVAFAYSIST